MSEEDIVRSEAAIYETYGVEGFFLFIDFTHTYTIVNGKRQTLIMGIDGLGDVKFAETISLDLQTAEVDQTNEFMASKLGQWLRDLGTQGIAFRSRSDPTRFIPPQASIDTSIKLTMMPHFMPNLTKPFEPQAVNGIAPRRSAWHAINVKLKAMQKLGVEQPLSSIKDLCIFATVWGKEQAGEDYQKNVELAIDHRNNRNLKQPLNLNGVTFRQFMRSRIVRSRAAVPPLISHRNATRGGLSDSYIQYRKELAILMYPDLSLTLGSFVDVRDRHYMLGQHDFFP